MRCFCFRHKYNCAFIVIESSEIVGRIVVKEDEFRATDGHR
jgi:hypothetical protein